MRSLRLILTLGATLSFLHLNVALGDPAHPTQVSLVTLAPQPTQHVARAFGHTDLLIEHSDRRFVTLIYYGAVGNLGDLTRPARLLQTIGDLLRERIAVTAKIERLPRSMLKRYYMRHYKGAIFDPILLSAEQTTKLEDLIDQTFQGKRRVDYEYGNFTRNCTTKIRDLIYGAVDPQVAGELKSADSGRTYSELTLDALNEIIPRYGSVTLGDRAQFLGASRLLGVSFPAQVHSGQELFNAIDRIVARLKELADHARQSGADDQGSIIGDISKFLAAPKKKFIGQYVLRSGILDAYDAYRKQVFETPISQYDAIFMPHHLRQALLDAGLIDGSQAVRIGNMQSGGAEALPVAN